MSQQPPPIVRYGLVTRRWSGSLGDMLASGCLLAIADDASVLPFAETLRWQAFSLRVPEAAPAALPALIDALTDAQLTAMLHAWRAARPSLLYQQTATTQILHSLWLRESSACVRPPVRTLRVFARLFTPSIFLSSIPPPSSTLHLLSCAVLCTVHPASCKYVLPPASCIVAPCIVTCRFVMRSNARRAVCLSALAASPGPFALDADAAAMSAQQREACAIQGAPGRKHGAPRRHAPDSASAAMPPTAMPPTARRRPQQLDGRRSHGNGLAHVDGRQRQHGAPRPRPRGRAVVTEAARAEERRWLNHLLERG